MLEIPNDIHKISRPLSVAQSGIDKPCPPPKAEVVQKTLQTKTEKGEGPHQFVSFPEAQHGFALRGRLDDGEQARRAREAEEQAVEWFKRWLWKEDGPNQ